MKDYNLIDWILPPTITKESVLFIKGVAIMMMVYLHLFCWKEVIPLYTSSFYIEYLPFAYCLSRTMSPTGIFLFLGGYGLFCKWIKSNYNFKQATKRLPKLYIVYWLITIIFVSIGTFLGKEQYPGSCYEVFLNVTAIRATYNREAWFLFPYVFLILLSPLLFRLVNKTRWWLVALGSLCVFYSEALLYGRAWSWIYDHTFALCISRCIEVSCCFMLGAVFAKICIEKKSDEANKLIRYRSIISVVLLVVLSIYTVLNGIPFAPLWYSIMTLLFANISFHIQRHTSPLWQFFLFMGRYSLPIWLLHTYYCRYLFQDFIYSFEYPVFIYLVELVLSTLSAVLVMKVAAPIIKLVSK